ncbi:tetratricopeptide repeat protein [Insolitispirillum peregrinum]|uniref:Tetratricopeptide repeat-containing protein n=1 Tax=Insolitispirillum peregrinum TaxID=80876 RepID=A0A1N7NQS3_9PROT|nr:tetratricopeptide repeat protein [Insolitispirillum peregrinum]SIT00753.1 Tetratricopeptide repeat-containing protein [Insolitispirillum peregrinum]
MPDRSVSAEGSISHSIIVTGDGSRVSLSFGASGLVLPVERKHSRRPDRRRQPHELDVLDPARGRMPLIGRERELSDLRGWLESDADISVHALIGSAGTGKTRLAIGLCEMIEAEGSDWLAGFLSPSHLPRLADAFATTAFEWTRSTLLVIDYAAQGYEALGHWLDHLAAGPALDGVKLRMLLLERQAPEGFGWWHELTASPLNASAERRDLFRRPRPDTLAGLADVEVRRQVLAAALAATADLHQTTPKPMPSPEDDPAFEKRLSEPVFGNALSLVMAGVIAHDMGLRPALALRRLDAARRLGQRELTRFATLAGPDAQAMRHLLAFNGMAGGLPVAGLTQQLNNELSALGASAHTQRLSELLQQELPPSLPRDGEARPERLATIQPDLIGEAVIIESFETTPERKAEGLATLQRAYALTGAATAQALMRLMQDYAYAVEDPTASDPERATGERLLGWLRGLAASLTDPEALEPLAFALPEKTLVLRDIAAEITGRLASVYEAALPVEGDALVRNLHRAMIWKGNYASRLSNLGRREEALSAAERTSELARHLAAIAPETFTLDLATSLSNQASFLNNLGRPEEGLVVAQQAVDLHHALATTRTGSTVPNLAASLNNLANALSALGQREKALMIARQAETLYRDLAAARPDAFTPDLAASLNNLAGFLSDLGRREEALAMAQETVELRRTLATSQPDAFKPALATSLNNMANFLSDLGQRKKAMAVAQQAVDLYRALAVVCPDAFTPALATSLNTLATCISDLGQREEALAVAQEAVGLYSALATARPDAFMPDLAGSLNTLAVLLHDIRRHEEALTVAQQAVDLRRALAVARPDAFTPALATSLNTLANRLSDLGQREEALIVAQEAVSLRRTLTATQPEAFMPALAMSLNNLANSLRSLGRQEEARVMAQEAVDLYRTLAAAQPDAFSVNLSISLGMFTDLMISLGDKQRALETCTEAIQALIPTFMTTPQVAAQWMTMHLQRYSSLCQDLEQELDESWLQPIVDALGKINNEMA